MRPSPKDLTDTKDVDNWFIALRNEARSPVSHDDLNNVEGANETATGITKNKHVSDYDLKKIQDHIDDDSKHIGQTLSNTANYISDITAVDAKIVIASPTPITRLIDAGTAAIVSAAQDTTTHNVSTTKPGFAPVSPNDSTKFLNGANPPAWAVPAGTTYSGGKNIEITGSTIDYYDKIGCSAYKTTQSISASTLTKIQFDTEDWDRASAFSTTNYEYTVPTGYDGIHMVIIRAASLANLDANCYLQIEMHKNYSPPGTLMISQWAYAPSIGGTVSVEVVRMLNLVGGDVISGYIVHNSSASVNCTGFINIAFIG